MKKIMITLMLLSLVGCDSIATKDENDFNIENDIRLKTINIDSCEYIKYNYRMFVRGEHISGITHKGNCKFCIKRNEIKINK